MSFIEIYLVFGFDAMHIQKCANADTIICVYDATFLCHPIQEKHDTMVHCQLKNSTPNYHGHDFTKKSVI